MGERARSLSSQAQAPARAGTLTLVSKSSTLTPLGRGASIASGTCVPSCRCRSGCTAAGARAAWVAARGGGHGCNLALCLARLCCSGSKPLLAFSPLRLSLQPGDVQQRCAGCDVAGQCIGWQEGRRQQQAAGRQRQRLAEQVQGSQGHCITLRSRSPLGCWARQPGCRSGVGARAERVSRLGVTE